MKQLFRKLTNRCNHQFVRKFETVKVNGKVTNDCYIIYQCMFCNKVSRVGKVTFTNYGAVISSYGAKCSVDKKGNDITK